MMWKAFLISFLGFLFLLQSDEKVQSALEKSRKISNELVDSVKSVLFFHLSKGGYTNAIQACSQIAQNIIKSHQEKYSVYVRRVSEKFRNPLDAPDEYETKILRKLDELNRKNELPNEYWEIVDEKGKRYLRYFKPLIVQPMCLNCHGTDEFLKDEIKKFLSEKYPNDKATGYKPGDFRGAVSVKIEIK